LDATLRPRLSTIILRSCSRELAPSAQVEKHQPRALPRTHRHSSSRFRVYTDRRRLWSPINAAELAERRAHRGLLDSQLSINYWSVLKHTSAEQNDSVVYSGLLRLRRLSREHGTRLSDHISLVLLFLNLFLPPIRYGEPHYVYISTYVTTKTSNPVVQGYQKGA
jgi:hypothetical protein